MTNVIDSDMNVEGLVAIGAGVANPPAVSGGSGAMNTVNRTAGSFHMRTGLNQLPEILHNSEVLKVGLAKDGIECRLVDLVANSANTYTTYIPRNAKILGVSRRYTLIPASSAGSIVVGITVAGNQILATSSEDESGLTNDTLTTHNLTGTAASLLVSEGDKVIITVTSNNADMVNGTGGQYWIYYEAN